MQQDQPSFAGKQDHLKQIAAQWVGVQPMVAVFLRSSVRDQHAADDLLQEVATNVITSYDRFDPDRSFKAWVMGIARNCLMTYYRSASRDQIIFDGELLDQMTATYERMSDESDLLREALKWCLSKLPDRTQRIFEYYYAKRIPTKDIAEKMGMSPSAVRVLMHRVRNALRVCAKKHVVQLRESPRTLPQNRGRLND